jgi:hypothetical protein
MESHELDDRATAEAQLATLQAQRSALAERAITPWWYDALLGFLLFGFIASYSAHSTWVTIAALVVFLMCLRGMVVLYRRLTGFWVDGFRRGTTRRAIAAWIVGCLAVLGAGFAAEDRWRGSMVVAGAVLAVGLVLVNRWWGRLYVAELRGRQ